MLPLVAVTVIVALVLVEPPPPKLELPPPQPTLVTRKAARQRTSKPLRCFEGNDNKQTETMLRPAVPINQFSECRLSAEVLVIAWAAVVAMLRVAGALVVVALKSTELGLSVQVARVLLEVQVRLTVPLNPFVPLIVSAVVVGCPPTTLRLCGFEETEKPLARVNAFASADTSTEPSPVTWS